MNIVREDIVAPNAGWMADIDAGQVLRIAATSVIDFIAYNRADQNERFDVARTRVYNLNIYPTKGHRLFSKQNNPMMRMVEDGFAGIGTHDLQSSHGCSEAMLEMLAPLGISPEDLPDPLGLFRNIEMEQATGRITPTPLGPKSPVHIDLEAEIDLICALMNCPDPRTSAPGSPATITVFDR